MQENEVNLSIHELISKNKAIKKMTKINHKFFIAIIFVLLNVMNELKFHCLQLFDFDIFLKYIT